MFPLLGYASSMIGGDSVMDLVDRLNLWRILDAIWLPILLYMSYHTGAYFPYQRGPPTCDCRGVWYVVLGHISFWAFLS